MTHRAMKSSSKKNLTPSTAHCLSRATGKTVNWRTVFAVAAAMRKLQPTRLLGPARLKQWALKVNPEKHPANKITVKITPRPDNPPYK
jgi:hypothetical protein